MRLNLVSTERRVAPAQRMIMLDMYTQPTHTRGPTCGSPTLNPCRGQVSVNCFLGNGWITALERKQGGVREEDEEKKRPSLIHTHTYIHANMVWTHTHTHTSWHSKDGYRHSERAHSLAHMPESSDCHRLISGEAAGVNLIEVALTVLRFEWRHQWSGRVTRFNYKHTDVGIKPSSVPEEEVLSDLQTDVI